MAQLNVSISDSSNLCITFQNYFGDPWNTFDFVIVLGSFIDIIYSELNVSQIGLSLDFFLSLQDHFFNSRFKDMKGLDR